MWKMANQFLLWAPMALCSAYVAILGIATQASPTNHDASRFVDKQIYYLGMILSSNLTFFVILFLVIFWVAAFLFSKLKMEDELLRLAGEQVDRRKDDLERWVRVNFDSVYNELMDVSLEKNKIEVWNGFEIGREYKAEEIMELKDNIPSDVICDSIGFVEAQVAFLQSILVYREWSRELHDLAKEFGVSDVKIVKGYCDWRNSDLLFVDALKKYSNEPNFSKLRILLKRDWIGRDRAKWPDVL